MHTNRVSHQRNVIRLHSYIEYFSRNFLLFPSPFHALFYRLQFRWWKFSGKLTRPHASRTSEMWNVNKRARFVNVAQKTKVYVTGWRPAISSLWIAFWKQNAHLARVARSPRLQFLADNREKSANSGPRICPHWGFFFSFWLIIILGSLPRLPLRILIWPKKRFVSMIFYLLCSNDFVHFQNVICICKIKMVSWGD